MNDTKSTSFVDKVNAAIKSICDRNNISLSKATHMLAKALGYSTQQLYNWKRGEIPHNVQIVNAEMDQAVARLTGTLETPSPTLSTHTPKSEMDIFILFGELKARITALEKKCDELLERDRLVGTIYRLRKGE